MASLTHQQDRSLNGQQYRVVSTILSGTGITPAVFVFATVDDSFSRVASVQDLADLQPSRAAAVTAGDEYYRLVTVTRDFDVLEDAQDFANYVKGRLPQLVIDYNLSVTAFVGTSTDVVSSP
jgi:hypothetical protein